MQMLFFGISSILAGVIMLIITVVLQLKLLSFRNCEVMSATVTDVAKHSHYANGHHRTSYNLSLSYDVDGIAYERKLSCGKEEYELGVNRKVEICYKAQNPKRIILNCPEKNTHGQKTLWIVTAVLVAAGAVLILLSGRLAI